MKNKPDKLQQIEEEYSFFREAILDVSSSLDLPQAMITAFEFLSRHFPLEGLSLHKLDPEKQALQLMFLVTDGQFIQLDETIPLSMTGFEKLKDQERTFRISVTNHSKDFTIANNHGLAISSHLPHKDRGYLVAILPAQKESLGHLCLIGSKPSCFTEEHRQKLSVIVPAFSLAMINLLQYRKIVQLKEKETQEKQYLAEKVRYLSHHDIIGAEGGLQHIMKMVDQLTGRDVPVLITGETGSGKEILADAIQQVSPRFDAPFIKVNCGAIPDNLIDSELFGHEKGSFTGAISRRLGRFEQADGGTLFLDEIGDMPLHAQTRLLRVLQNGTMERVGGHKSIKVDVRVIVATHRDLKQQIQSGNFREDLYYRLNVFPMHIPALRDRRQDILPLVHHFIRSKVQELQLDNTPKIDPDSIQKLMEYNWPGNIRELENLIERALIIDPAGPLQLHSLISFDQGATDNALKTDSASKRNSAATSNQSISLTNTNHHGHTLKST